jgi:DNA repair protein RecO (recombination protein O)
MSDYSTTILVLKKTKLGETDLIITGFSQEGRQVRAVAKGARRPGSKLGVHLELYSVARVLLHRGRSLDIIVEASGMCSNEDCRGDVLHSAAAATVVELLDKVSAEGDTEARLFPLACEALRCVGAVPDEGVSLIAATAILKTAAQLGFRPSLKTCVACGAPVAAERGEELADEAPGTTSGEREGRAQLAFSNSLGGVLCVDCVAERGQEGYRLIDSSLITWAEVLITSRFIELEPYATPTYESLGPALLNFAREWLRFHLVSRLRSLDFLINLN